MKKIPPSQIEIKGTLTLPILEAFSYLHANNLTIDRLFTVIPKDGPPETHITVKPRPEPEPEKPKGDKQ